MQYEIVTVDDEAGSMRWRLSTADLVADAPFSEFPEVRREFCLASGAGVTLTIEGVERACGPGSITVFDGGAETSMRLWDGPSRAVNLMCPATASGPFLRVVESGRTESSVLAVVSLDDASTLTLDGDRLELDALDSAHLASPCRLEVSAGRVVAVVADR